jgi:hypothetical protein
MFRKTIAFLITWLILQPLCTVQDAIASQQSQEERSRQESVKAKVNALGIGAEIKALLDGKSRQGRIVEIQDQAFVLDEKVLTSILRYDEVQQVVLAESKYKAQGQVDPDRVRQVVVDIGVGKQAVVMLVSKMRVQGKIEAIENTSFTIVDSKAGVSTPVTYSEVLQIKRKGFPGWAIAAILACIAGAVIVGYLLFLNNNY